MHGSNDKFNAMQHDWNSSEPAQYHNLQRQSGARMKIVFARFQGIKQAQWQWLHRLASEPWYRCLVVSPSFLVKVFQEQTLR
jgi:hypothetical protein